MTLREKLNNSVKYWGNKSSPSLASRSQGIGDILTSEVSFRTMGAGIGFTASLLFGGLVSIPIAAYVVRRFHPKHLKGVIGIVSILLGIAILSRLIL